jgi:hypothetical protein
MVAGAARRPGRTLAVALLVALAGGALALLRLSPSAGTGSLVGSGSASGRATATMHQKFGDDAVYVLVRGDLPRIVLTANLNRLLGLEGCLSGNVPRGAQPPGGPGRRAAARGGARRAGGLRAGDVHQLLGDELTTQLQAQTRARARQADRAAAAASKLALADGRSPIQARRLGDQAAKLVYAQFAQQLLALSAKYGLNLPGAPQLNDPDFVYQLVFDPRAVRARRRRASPTCSRRPRRRWCRCGWSRG